jgi:hypothetical protein
MVDVSSIGSSLSGFKGGFANISSYAWVLYIFVPLAIIVFGIFLWKMLRDKNLQWTHKLKIRRVMANNILSDPIIIKMRRFSLIKRADVFELEKPVLGGYLMPELDSYTGLNEFSIIIDTNNRIYVNTGEYFNPDKSCVNVSAKHAEIDLSRADLRADYQNINKTSKRVEWKEVAKFIMLGLLIIATMIVLIKGIGQWGENHKIDAEKAMAEAEAMRNLADAMETTQATMNAQVLVLDLLKKNYGTNNIQGVIQERIGNGTI